MQPSHDDEQDAIENLQLLSTRSMNTITSVSPFQHQATTLLDPSVSSHSVRVPSTMRRRSSKYDLFSALSLPIFSLTCDFHLIFQAHSPTAADRSVHVPTAPIFTVGTDANRNFAHFGAVAGTESASCAAYHRHNVGISFLRLLRLVNCRSSTCLAVRHAFFEIVSFQWYGHQSTLSTSKMRSNSVYRHRNASLVRQPAISVEMGTKASNKPWRSRILLLLLWWPHA